MTNAQAETCESCGTILHETDRSDDGVAGKLCTRCRDLMFVREAFDARLIDIMTLGLRVGDVSRALAILDEVNSAWMQRDHDGWLDKSVRSSRALILSRNGRHEEALGDLRVVEANTFFGGDDYVLNKISIARTLEGAGRLSDALGELVPVIAVWENLPIGTIPGLLSVYADIASGAEVAVDAHCCQILAAWEAKVGMSIHENVSVNDFREAARDANKEWNQAHRRFAAMCSAIRGGSREVREGSIAEYVASEPVGYLRERARSLLDEPEEE